MRGARTFASMKAEAPITVDLISKRFSRLAELFAQRSDLDKQILAEAGSLGLNGIAQVEEHQSRSKVVGTLVSLTLAVNEYIDSLPVGHLFTKQDVVAAVHGRTPPFNPKSIDKPLKSLLNKKIDIESASFAGKPQIYKKLAPAS